MRVPSLSGLAFPALLVGVGVAVLAASARAGDAPAAPRKIESGFLRDFVGDWDTEMTAGRIGKHRGTSRWQLTLDQTAIEEEYSSSMTGTDGKTVPWKARVVLRELGGGKVEAWMFDTTAVAPLHFTGTVTEMDLDVSADSPAGRFHVTCKKKRDDREFRIVVGDELHVAETYRPAVR